MKFLWLNIESNKKHKAELSIYEDKLRLMNATLTNVVTSLTEYRVNYPLTMGETVYDIRLKNSKGKFTKKSPSREHSSYSEVVVTPKNYFGLVERYRNNDVFLSEEEAIAYLDSICT